MRYKVFLPTSGIGSRMGELTTYTNKSMAKIGDKPAISYIVEKYPEDVEIIVTLGHFGSHVQEFLEIAYPTRRFTFVTVDNYKGPGSSLIYSFLCAKEHIDCPFIFHACDTLVGDDLIPEPTEDWLGGCEHKKGKEYTSFDTNYGKVLRVFDKGRIDTELVFVGIAGIFNWKRFKAAAVNLHATSPDCSELSNIHVHQFLIANDVFYKYYKFPHWEDIGTEDKFNYVSSCFSASLPSLNKKNEAIFKVDDKVIKFYSEPGIVNQKVERATILKGLVPAIIDKRENFFSYKFVEGPVLSTVVNEQLFEKFLDWCRRKLWVGSYKNHDGIKNIIHQFYFMKTATRINQFLEQRNTEHEDIVSINGEDVPSAFALLSSIPVDWLCSTTLCGFHGDLILDNVVVNGDSFTLMDWRQSFAKNEIFGDIYYDLSKINGSLIFNQELVRQGHFLVETNGTNIHVDILLSYTMRKCHDIFRLFLKKNSYDELKVDILTSLMWLNMAPLHSGELGMFLYYFGRSNLYRVLEEMQHEK